MALIKCPECEKDISDSAKKCPNCGYKIKKAKNKRFILLICVVFVIIITCAIGISIKISIDNKNAIAQEQKNIKDSEEKYNDLIIEVGGETYIYGIVAELFCNDISQVWYNSIFKKSDYKYNQYTQTKYGGYNDFNTSISNYKTKNAESFSKLKEKQNELESNMKKLKDVPSNKFQSVYDEMIDFYGIFSKLVDMAVSPSGTYQDYIQKYNSYATDFESSYNKIKVLKPEIAEYTEKE